MAALRRPRRGARRLARRYQAVILATMVMCMLVWYALSDHDCSGAGCLRGSRDASPPARRLFEVRDQFTQEQRRHGAVLLHCIGLLYMFAAIAIVCDECFVPALEVITEVLELSPDVAGATFMAAGGSAPEFFTSLIGSLVTESDVGTGTIIGSAVFNVLFVIGACAIVAPTPLQLTWFPLFRDSCFYAVDLIVVTCVFLDEQVKWYEAFILLILYLFYVTFMRFSTRVEAWALGTEAEAEEQEDGNSWATSREKLEAVQEVDVGGTGGTGDASEEHHAAPMDQRPKSFIRSSSSVSVGANGHKKEFRHHSMRTHTQINSVKHLDPGSTGGSGDIVMAGEPKSEVVLVPEPVPEDMPKPDGSLQHMELNVVPDAPNTSASSCTKMSKNKEVVQEEDPEDSHKDEEEEEDKPLSFYPPEDGSPKDMAYWLVTLPIVFVLVFTIPDVRREGFRKFFAVTFVMSILWIAFFTWAMVWFCEIIGETAGISDSILGMTVLAAGTSVPDMISSMIVAREGHGDMAVSSSIGSNIFDVTVGLPVPWLLFNAVRNRPVSIVNTGLEISVMILLAMLGVTVSGIMCHGWSMTKWMGGSFMFLYLVFQGISVGLFIYTENGGSLKLIHV